MTTKRCFKCLCEKPILDFYKCATTKDGLLGKCKACTIAGALEYRQKNLDRIRAYDRERSEQPHRVALLAERSKNYYSKFPLRVAANLAVRRAVRDGIIKKLPCLICGEQALAHHPDYSRPLDVVWLCQPHHKQAHAIV